MTRTPNLAVERVGADGAAASPQTRYRAAVLANDVHATIGVVEDLLAAGDDPITVLLEVVARAQREVGWRWQRGQISVADERAATALAVRATEVVGTHLQDRPRTQGSVVIACAEREWHALPAMIVECAARAAGWDTTLLGASTAVALFNDHLDRLNPDATAVSASVLGSLPTARRLIEASTTVGVPVLAGGAAFGPDAQRANALGATAWARDATGAVAALAALPPVVAPAPPLPPAAAAEHAALSEAHRHLVAHLRRRWEPIIFAANTADPAHDVIDVADDVLHQILHALHAVLLTGDPRPLPDTAAWATDVVTARGGDDVMLDELGALIHTALRDYPLSITLCDTHLTPHLSTHP